MRTSEPPAHRHQDHGPLQGPNMRGRLVGEAWVPIAGLNAGEVALCLPTLASSCDCLEYILTGRDEE
jgi:hypothetical protein